MAFWIFKSNPDKYRLSERLADPNRVISWQVNQHRSEIGVGDLVFIWESGPNRGVRALMRVETTPHAMAELDTERPYDVGPDTEVRLRVLGILIRRNLSLFHSALRNEPGLGNLSVFRRNVVQSATNFPVTLEEGAILLGLIRDAEDEEEPAPSELPVGETVGADLLPEGTRRQASGNVYERNPAARQRCIEHYGAQCCICGIEFGAAYGPEFAGLIEVHHLRPLSEVGGNYLVNPITDLRPVCPNCHAVIHHQGETRSIEAVRQLLDQRRRS